MSTSFTAGQRVSFKTPGKYAKDAAGTIQSITSAYAYVKCDDGKTRAARPGTLRAA